MAEKEKGKKGKKSRNTIITAILVPILIVVMISSMFFAVIDAIIDIISSVIGSIISNIASFLSNPFKWVSSKWATFTNFLDRTIGAGDVFNENEYEDARKNLEASVVIDETDFNNMKAALDGKINKSATGLDDIMLKKMLLAYYRGLYLKDTNVLMELSDEDLKADDDEFKPFSKVKGDSDTGKGEDGKWYLQTKGMIEIKTGDTNLIYYPIDTLKEIYQKHYANVVEDNEEYAESVLEYLEKCYTYSSSGIQIYATTTDKKTEIWKYENSEKELTINRESTSSVSLTTVEFYEKISQYVTPVEFIVNLMEVTGSKDFVNAFIETVGTETGIKMELAQVSHKETTKEVEERTRDTILTGEKGEDYSYIVKKLDGTVLEHSEEKIEGTNEINITVNSNGTDCKVTLYTNDIPETETKKWKEGTVTHTTTINKTYELNKDNNWTKTWSNKTKSDSIIKEKQDISKVIHTTTTTHKEGKYDLAISEVTTWYAKITQDNSKDTRTIYSSIAEDNSEVGIDNKDNVIKIAQSDENSEYTSTTNPNIFKIKDYENILPSDTKTFSMEECLNLQYNYIRDIEENDYDPEEYTFTKMTSKDTQVTKSTLKTTTIKTFEKGTQKVSENTDLFLGLLSNKDGKYVPGAKFKAKSAGGKVVKYPDLYGKIQGQSKVGAGDLLVNGAEMFFLLLEKSKNTQGLADVMRYILYLYSGIDYGVTSLNFDMFASDKFISVGASGLGVFKEYLHTWENAGGPPTNADGTKYIIEDDGAGHPTVGYGVDIFKGGFAPLFEAAGYSTQIGAEVDKEFVDSLEEQEISSNLTQIRAITSGLNLTEYQIHALVSRAYNCGISGATGVRNGKTFVQAYNEYWNQEKDDLYDGKNSTADFTHLLYTKYMNQPTTSDGKYMAGLERRRKSEWILFQTGYYNVINQWYTKTGELVSSAYNVADHFINSGVTVHYAGNDVQGSTNNGRSCVYGNIQGSWNYPISNPENYGVVCATFVSLAIWQAGLIDEATINNYGYNSCTGVTSMLADAGWEKIYSASELQPGDVVFQPGHVMIYVGDGKIIDQNYCVVQSSGKDIRGTELPVPSSQFSYAYRYVGTGK